MDTHLRVERQWKRLDNLEARPKRVNDPNTEYMVRLNEVFQLPKNIFVLKT
jgi:hypothetical protein